MERQVAPDPDNLRAMDTNTLLIIVVLVVLFGGGVFYRGRRR